MGEGLRNLGEADPGLIRARVARAVLERADADSAVVYGVAESDREPGALDIAWWKHAGDSSIDSSMRVLATDPALRPKESALTFRRPPRVQTTSFLDLDRLTLREAFEGSAFEARCFRPFGIRDQIRLLAFHGSQFVGFVGAFRNSGPRFARADRRRLAPLVDDARAALAAADCLERKEMPDCDAFLVLRADGSIEYSTFIAAGWLDRSGIGAALVAAVREIDRSSTTRWTRHFGAARIELVRLDGASVRYLAMVAPGRTLALRNASRLSPRELAVAEIAAAGGTIDEIARSLGSKSATVHAQLRTIYRKLRVSSRVELAETLDAEIGSADERGR